MPSPESDAPMSPAGGHSQPTVTPCAVGQAGSEVAAAPPAGQYDDTQAWMDNYYGMSARWTACDAERLVWKRRALDAEMRLRALCPLPSGADPESDAGCRPRTGWLSAETYCSTHGRSAGWPCTAARVTPPGSGDTP